jgi:hypothetical protein
LEQILHDDLIPVGTANPAGRLVPEGIDPARALKALPAVQSIGRKGAQGELLFVAPPGEILSLIMER